MSVMRFLILALLLVFSSCGGTEAGNPSLSTASNPGAGAGPVDNLPEDLASVNIVSSICSKLIQCNPSLTLSNCTAGVEKQTNLTPAFGVAPTFGTFANVIKAETVGTLRADPVRAQTCINEIQAQSCVSPTVSGAYSAAAPASFTSVINMIPTSGTSCAGVF